MKAMKAWLPLLCTVALFGALAVAAEIEITRAGAGAAATATGWSSDGGTTTTSQTVDINPGPLNVGFAGIRTDAGIIINTPLQGVLTFLGGGNKTIGFAGAGAADLTYSSGTSVLAWGNPLTVNGTVTSNVNGFVSASTGTTSFYATGATNSAASFFSDATTAGISLGTASGNNAVAVRTNGARIDFGAGANDYMTSDGTDLFTSGGTFIHSSRFSSFAGVGGTGFAIETNGAFIDFGSGANDKASSDGTTVTFAGPVTITGNTLATGGFNSSNANSNAFTISGSGGRFIIGSAIAIQNTAPTLTSFGGTGASIVSNGTAAFDIDVGTVAPGGTGTITLPTATTGWVCHCQNITNPATSVINQSGGSTTTCPIVNYVRTTGIAGNWTASDHLRCTAMAY